MLSLCSIYSIFPSIACLTFGSWFEYYSTEHMGQLHNKGESRRLQGDGVKKNELFLVGFFKVGNVGDLVLPPWV